MDFEFSGPIWYWRGPAPWYFVTVPEKQCEELDALSRFVTYGWGMIPATVRIGRTEYRTAPVAERRPLHRPDQGQRPEGRRDRGRRHGDGAARSALTPDCDRPIQTIGEIPDAVGAQVANLRHNPCSTIPS